jgi:hypothetical protein
MNHAVASRKGGAKAAPKKTGGGLRINKPDDIFEFEADRVADQVMAGNIGAQGWSLSKINIGAPLQKKCDCGGAGECDECRKKELRRKTGAAVEEDEFSAPPVVDDVLRSPGTGLDSDIRGFMEPRFGHNFSDVRVHTDSRAGESARAVNALAYTVGRHVVFGPGRFAPGSVVGRGLLAHELAHTIQQTSGTPKVQRATPPVPTPLPATMPAPGPGDFELTGIPVSSTNQIFFAKNSSVPGTDAKTQIAALKSSAPGTVKLLGFSSADETATVAQSRADSVKSELTKAPNPVTVSSATGDPTAQVGQANFPSVRKVDVVIGAAAPPTFNCHEKDAAGNLVHPPKQPCSVMDPATQSACKAALTIANDAMSRATAAVAGTPNAADAANIKEFFGNTDPGTLSALKTNLGNLKTHVSGLPAITSCGGQCDPDGCNSGKVIAYNQGIDSGSTMTLCVPTFKSLPTDNDRARNLIHESAHGTSPLGGTAGTGTKDVAYRHERMIFQLAPADRLRNSDSYALFALFLRERQITHTATARPAGISTPANDTIAGFSTTPAPSELDAVKLALAKLEKRLTWAATRTGQLYGQITAIRDGSQTWAASSAEDLMKEAAKVFPLTAPPGIPTVADQAREAGILDRYQRMKELTKKDLTITRMASGVVAWPTGATGSVLASISLQIGPDFFSATPDNQISLLLEGLARATPDIEPAFVPAYVSLAEWIHKKNP